MGSDPLITTKAPKLKFDIAEILRRFSHYRTLRSTEAKVVSDITNCRTSVLGGHVFECDKCGAEHFAYNSCRNRHCPQCQFLPKVRWLEARKAELLPVQYFHVVFTLPDELNALFLTNKRICYGLLFKAMSETLKDVAQERLNAQVGITAVLHTWGQKLNHRPHIHALVTGGGLSLDDRRWISCKQDYFLPVKILSKVFRGKLLSYLEQNEKALVVKTGNLKSILIKAARPEWIVYAKAPFAGPEQVLNYLGQYTHKVAITNNRIKNIDQETVTFSYRDRADQNEIKDLTLRGNEFVRRFLFHVLPKKFVRIRHYGLLGKRNKKKNLNTARELLNASIAVTARPPDADWKALIKRVTGVEVDQCPTCRAGRMRITGTLLPHPNLRQWRNSS